MNVRDACPKCGAPRRAESAACPKCGLLVSKWDTFARSVPTPTATLQAAWEKLQTDWQNEAAHKRFVDFAANQHELDVAAALYRAYADANPSDSRARDGMERTAKIAAVLGGRDAKIVVPGWLRWVSISVALALVVITIQIVRLSLHR